jgi:tetratricopeptide (TPR) repeat protein
MSQWPSVRNRLAGKWQLPLLAVSLLLLPLAVLSVRKSPDEIPLTGAIERIDALLAGGMYDTALGHGRHLLTSKERTNEELAPVLLRLGRAAYGAALLQKRTDLAAGKLVVDYYELARSYGQELTADDERALGWGYEWSQQPRRAIEHYQAALDGGVEDRDDLAMHVLKLKRAHVTMTPDEQLAEVHEFLTSVEPHRLDLQLWALETELELLDRLGRLEEGATLLGRYREAFRGSSMRDHLEYLETWLLYRAGAVDEAELRLRALRDRLPGSSDLDARVGWLLGRSVLGGAGGGRPLEALSFFDDVIEQHSVGPYVAASRLGRAEALVQLHRHEEAIEAYTWVVESLAASTQRGLIDRDVVRVSLSVQAGLLRQSDELEPALRYAELAAVLSAEEEAARRVPVLGELEELQTALAERRLKEAADQQQLAEATWASLVVGADDQEARQAEEAAAKLNQEALELLAQAAETNLELARVATMNEDASSMAAWRAAELFNRAGERRRAVSQYATFIRERPDHPLVARAMRRKGELLRALGEPQEAVVAFQECWDRFPLLLDGARALIPLAECYFSMGPEHDERAERTLRIVLDDPDLFTPEAPEFAEALFLLGDVLNRRGSYEEAIAVLDEALARYPDDDRQWRARYVLADSYRQSALAVKNALPEARFAGELLRLKEQMARRFARARELYRLLVEQFELMPPDRLSPLQRLYLRHAYLYEADCYFENQQYRQALKLYEEAAAVYKDVPSGLAAYVQIINCHVFLGEPAEARAALARALILVDAMPDGAFEVSISPETRGDWRRYFEWLEKSELF